MKYLRVGKSGSITTIPMGILDIRQEKKYIWINIKECKYTQTRKLLNKEAVIFHGNRSKEIKISFQSFEKIVHSWFVFDVDVTRSLVSF